VDIESAEGAGTTIELRLPLSLSVIEGFWVEVAGTEYVLPLDDVVECLEVPEGRRDLGETERIIDLRGEPLACVHLRSVLETSEFVTGGAWPVEQIVVVRHRSNLVGLGVDAIGGQRQTVIRPLGRLFRAQAAVSGSAIRPDGSVALVIDVARLLRSVTRAGMGSARRDVSPVVGAV
jgi:two-component system chemotaxis sensor kinase CheA